MIASEAQQVQLSDGAVSAVEQWGRVGPLLLCVHGITSSRRMWARTAEYFSAKYRVVAYDQRGHGDSAAVRGPMTLERSLADLEQVVATLDGPIRGLIGHSWGGAVAIVGGRRVACGPNITIDVFTGEGHTLQRSAFEKFAAASERFLDRY